MSATKEELVREIKKVFDSSNDFSMDEERVWEIQQAVLEGSYELSPLRLEFFQKDQPEEGFSHSFCLPDLPDFDLAVRPEQGDALVLIALALSLHFASSFWSSRLGFERITGCSIAD